MKVIISLHCVSAAAGTGRQILRSAETNRPTTLFGTVNVTEERKLLKALDNLSCRVNFVIVFVFESE